MKDKRKKKTRQLYGYTIRKLTLNGLEM